MDIVGFTLIAWEVRTTHVEQTLKLRLDVLNDELSQLRSKDTENWTEWKREEEGTVVRGYHLTRQIRSQKGKFRPNRDECEILNQAGVVGDFERGILLNENEMSQILELEKHFGSREDSLRDSTPPSSTETQSYERKKEHLLEQLVNDGSARLSRRKQMLSIGTILVVLGFSIQILASWPD